MVARLSLKPAALSAVLCAQLAASLSVGSPHALRSSSSSSSARLPHSPQLSTLTAPPAPPPTATNQGGGGGGDGGGDFLRLVAAAEAAPVLLDWQSRSRIYRMTDDSEIKERHSSALETIEDMLDRCESSESCALPIEGEAEDYAPTPAHEPDGFTDISKRMLTLGLFGPTRILPHALADAEISPSGALVIKSMALNPVENNEMTSTAALRILCGLRSLAETIGVQLDIEALKHVNKGRFWLAGAATLPSTPTDDGK